MKPAARRPRSLRCPARLRPLAAALVWVAWPLASSAGMALQMDMDLAFTDPSGGGAPAATAPEGGPVYLSADRVQSIIGEQSLAEGEVELRQAGLTLTADEIELLHRTQVAIARGRVRLIQQGNRFSGSEAQVQLEHRTGTVLKPDYFFARVNAGGRAERLDFIGTDSLTALSANYTSCLAAGDGEPDWLLSADRLDLDFEHNDGRARGAVLHFLGVPILAAPVLSFPASGERKSGWLPPLANIDSRSGVELEVPYYWNLAPNYDATLTPGVLTRRGVSLKTELRFLEASDQGRLFAHSLPTDRAAGRSRYALQFEEEGRFATPGGWLSGLTYSAAVQHASDDAYWKDFSGVLPSLTPRLLAQDLRAAHSWSLPGQASLESYGRIQGWQVLQDTEVILPPYQRFPQVGLRGSKAAGPGFNWRVEGEFNRFVLRDQVAGTDSRGNGSRLHVLGDLSHLTDTGWGWLMPRLSMNAAAYDTERVMIDGRRRATRVIPTFSLDAGLRFERDSTLLGRDTRQSLEPRLHYVNTPWRNQDALPNFDAAANDFNEISIYGDNAFSGVDYVTDSHQVTLGATSRWFDSANGAEQMRLGLAQRYLLRDQRITPDRLTPTGLSAENGVAATRFSDLLLFGSGTLLPHWRLEGTVQYSPDQSRTQRSILSARWQPEPFHTVSATYRFARGLNEQFELGWQWPVYRREGATTPKAGSSCAGTLYGVGRVNYSMQDSRITDSIVGLEYDAGCWVGRAVAERVSTGRAEATTKLLLQLELIGLSRLGSNPLKVLKDNIPGYQLLRDDSAATTTTDAP